MTISVKEISTNNDLRKFIKFPIQLFKNHPNYVPALTMDEINTLDPKKNPAFQHCEARY